MLQYGIAVDEYDVAWVYVVADHTVALDSDRQVSVSVERTMTVMVVNASFLSMRDPHLLKALMLPEDFEALRNIFSKSAITLRSNVEYSS